MQRWVGTSGHSAASAFSNPAAPSMIEELGRPQPARDQIIEHAAPGGFAFAPHVAHRQQNLLPVATDAEDDQERDVGGLAVEPHAHHAAVEDQPDDVLLARSRRVQASQSVFTLRHTRLTTSLPIAPLNSAPSARFTRRVLVPAR